MAIKQMSSYMPIKTFNLKKRKRDTPIDGCLFLLKSIYTNSTVEVIVLLFWEK